MLCQIFFFSRKTRIMLDTRVFDQRWYKYSGHSIDQTVSLWFSQRKDSKL